MELLHDRGDSPEGDRGDSNPGAHDGTPSHAADVAAARTDEVPRRIDLDRPFTRAQLRRAGIDPETLRGDDFVQALPRVWVCKRAIDHDTRIRAALVLHPEGAFASHLSAAEVLNLPVPDRGFAHVTVARHRDRRFRPGLKSHVTKRKRRIIVVRGIPTTDPIQTFIDCAGCLSLVDLVILGDALARRYKITARRLRKACAASTDYYAAAALRAATLVRDGVDSPMETRLRLLIVFAGLPEPTVNLLMLNDDGSLRRRIDLCYLAIKLIIEYDGRQHAEDTAQWKRDLDRREELDDEQYRVLVVTAAGIFQEPLRTLQRVRRQLVERGMPDVPEIGDGWKEHFAH